MQSRHLRTKPTVPNRQWNDVVWWVMCSGLPPQSERHALGAPRRFVDTNGSVSHAGKNDL